MPNTALINHNNQFPKSVIELAPGIWSAVGFAASNVHLIEGQNSVTIIDTSESTKAAENILGEFRRRTTKPVGRIIYTHSHRDHISGANIFSPGETVPIFASGNFKSDLVARDENEVSPKEALGRRTRAQFGIGLSPDERISLGCGPGNRPMEGLGAGFLAPTEMVRSNRSLDLDGVRAELLMAPGETDDHMVVWLPEQKVLFCGDNWYHAFPNLYAIRGTAYRDFAAWADSLKLLADLKADILAPGHTLPVNGSEHVHEVLSTTREAILHVMHYTAQSMDAGMPLDDIAASIRLPDHIADRPWLGEFYGKLSWSARAFAAGTLGWYDGNPTHLGTLTSKQRAEHMVALAGGVKALQQAAEKTDDLQWRLELCDHLIAAGQPAHSMKAQAMAALADVEINATARNSYLWEAARLREAEEEPT
ncbi:MAG: alkyl/aryl-sulfatase [Stappiaceae bacterium]